MKYIWALKIDKNSVNEDTEIELKGGLNSYRTLQGEVNWSYNEKVFIVIYLYLTNTDFFH